MSKFATEDAPVYDVPMSVINRPLPSELDESKVSRFVRDLERGDQFTAIEVLRCRLPDGRKYYFSFGGCHRLAIPFIISVEDPKLTHSLKHRKGTKRTSD